MKVFVIIGQNSSFENVSARAVYSRREDAESHLTDPARMWFDDRAAIVELELDKEIPATQSA